MAGNSVYRAIRIVLANTCANHLRTDEGSNAADHMYCGGAGKIMEAQLRQPAAAPNPVAADRINNSTDNQAVNAINEEVGTLCHRTGNNRCCCCAEHSLEDEERRARIACAIITLYEEVRRTDKAADIRAKHQAEADNPEHYRAKAHIHNVLHNDVGSVLRSRKACLDHRKARLHRKYQEGTYQHPYRICGYIFVHS